MAGRYVNVLNENYEKNIDLSEYIEDEIMFLVDFAFNRGKGLYERKELQESGEPFSSLVLLIVGVSEHDYEILVSGDYLRNDELERNYKE